VLPPVVVSRVEPNIANCAGQSIRGIPVAEAVIDEYGAVREVRMVKPVHPCIDRPMVEAVRQWRFKPATQNGEPVSVVFNLSLQIHWARN